MGSGTEAYITIGKRGHNERGWKCCIVTDYRRPTKLLSIKSRFKLFFVVSVAFCFTYEAIMHVLSIWRGVLIRPAQVDVPYI
jgi:hypothetical protein